MSGNNFNPNSNDSMFATILRELKAQNDAAKEWRDQASSMMGSTLEQVKLTNGRVTKLEREKWYQRGVIAGLSGVGTILWHFLTK